MNVMVRIVFLSRAHGERKGSWQRGLVVHHSSNMAVLQDRKLEREVRRELLRITAAYLAARALHSLIAYLC